MSNTLNILERTLAQVGDSTNTLHVLGTTNGRSSVYEPLLVRITDHADDDNTKTGAEADSMAIFVSQRHGEPFKKDNGVLVHKLHSMGQGFAGTFTVSTGAIATVTITNGGSGYSAGNSAIVIDGDTGGSAAVLTPTIVNGVITALAITTAGSGYTAGALVITNLAPTDTSILFPDYDYATFE